MFEGSKGIECHKATGPEEEVDSKNSGFRASFWEPFICQYFKNMYLYVLIKNTLISYAQTYFVRNQLKAKRKVKSDKVNVQNYRLPF